MERHIILIVILHYLGTWTSEMGTKRRTFWRRSSKKLIPNKSCSRFISIRANLINVRTAERVIARIALRPSQRFFRLITRLSPQWKMRNKIVLNLTVEHYFFVFREKIVIKKYFQEKYANKYCTIIKKSYLCSVVK